MTSTENIQVHLTDRIGDEEKPVVIYKIWVKSMILFTFKNLADY